MWVRVNTHVRIRIFQVIRRKSQEICVDETEQFDVGAKEEHLRPTELLSQSILLSSHNIYECTFRDWTSKKELLHRTTTCMRSLKRL